MSQLFPYGYSSLLVSWIFPLVCLGGMVYFVFFFSKKKESEAEKRTTLKLKNWKSFAIRLQFELCEPCLEGAEEMDKLVREPLSFNTMGKILKASQKIRKRVSFDELSRRYYDSSVFDSSNLKSNDLMLLGKIEQHLCAIGESIHHSDEHVYTSTQFSAQIKTVPETLSLSKEKLSSIPGKLIDKEINVGHKAFDKAFIIRGDESKVKQYLTSKRMNKLLQIINQVEFTLKDQIVSFKLDKEIVEFEKLKRNYQLLNEMTKALS